MSYSAPDEPIDETAAEEILVADAWRRGVLSWKLRDHQKEIYALVAGTKARKFFLDCSRRWGKSFVLFLYALEFGLKNRKAIIRFAAPTMTDLEEIYHPMFEEITEDCPADVKPVWQTTKGRGHYYFPDTGAKLYLFGTDHDNYKKARGKKTDLAIVDEAGSCDHVLHIVNSIILPQTLTTNGRIFIATTPAESPGHDSFDLKVECELAGNYVRKTIYDNTWLTPDLIAEYERESGGKESTAFRREYLCEWIVDDDVAVLPEFTAEHMPAIVQEPVVPPYFHPIVAMDVGWRDFTAVLFGYYDFLAAKLVVQDEVFLRKMTTDTLAAAIAEKEKALWPGRPAFGRWSDTDPIVIHDLSEMHALHFIPTAKDDKEAQVNKLRMWVKGAKIQVSPRCTNLVRHMRRAIWNKARTDFDRTKADGHFDGVDALVYMLRNAPVHANPYPALDPSVTLHTHWIPPAANETATDRAIAGMFRRKAG